jgi:hypothetical protein
MLIFLQIFLVVDILAAGAVAALALEHTIAHLRHRRIEERTMLSPQLILPNYLTPEVMEKLAQESEAQLHDAVIRSTSQLEQNLTVTSALLDKLVKRLGAQIVGDELERYRIELGELRQQAQKDIVIVKEDLTRKRAELETQLVAELTAEKERVIRQINTKLSDAVGSFLVDTLQHNIDLGTQEKYLMTLLEEHKAEFIRKVEDDES